MDNDQTYLSQLQDYYAHQRLLPSYAAIGTLLGLRSKSSVAALVARLKLQGYLDSGPDKRLKPTSRFFERHLADSSVRAGFPSPAQESMGDAITIDEFLVERPSQTVLVKVKGDSMIDAGIHAGDIVVVERRQAANPGDIVIAIVDNEFTLKYLEQDKNGFCLRPANPAYPVIRPRGHLELFGVVTGLIRKYAN
ncbi:MAG: translesion error-prone DNA polymerase V autoproteolytic subunit [Sulfuricellaceae bacterium]|nr:translesion error-prone DNA polymerase V autoproteolytic subunit [Sulfuricellaceae bacterium]